MRVIAGTLGGRRLAAPAGAGTRPTSDRVREAVFSMLGALDGLVVLDLFAGSGALGIEALSRGAAQATFVDTAPAALATLRGNLERLGLRERANVIAGDALGALRRPDKYDLVFLDPPYAMAAVLASELSGALPGVLAPDARVVCECDRRLALELSLPLLRERTYGDTMIRLHTAAAR